MSSTGAVLKGTDWWIMSPDGSEKQQLTHFEEPQNPASGTSATWRPLSSCKRTRPWW